ncbi:MAG: DUF1292 domain-containing protein [Acidibacillus sp.]|uniref:UPF0473 protein MM817_00041 n=1 Tax=Sulfoacidibacillus ferrooxidans TaxID=2005001 RepID=A0A9X1V962_9BACL|nr:DUF1292 domain-containing protein [Sulfoacidibacillus ferrooxidans]MCI0181807.1 hypothetical protein [Sulfoacidibacillus ferrooxidans]MCY0892894.1 DUF1292 domain-containing protein [Acidibacillus sp.]
MSNHDEHDDEHQHDHEHEFVDEEVVILEDEDGNEHEFLIAETFEVETRIYAVLVSADGTTEEGFIFRVEEKDVDGEQFLDFIAIEDDAEWTNVERVYNEMLEEDEQE